MNISMNSGQLSNSAISSSSYMNSSNLDTIFEEFDFENVLKDLKNKKVRVKRIIK